MVGRTCLACEEFCACVGGGLCVEVSVCVCFGAFLCAGVRVFLRVFVLV